MEAVLKVKSGLLFLFCCLLSFTASSQYYKININDNRNSAKNYSEYRITQDSLIIQSVSDVDHTNVDLLRRALKKKEKKRMLKFINTFPLDSLKEYYFTDYIDNVNMSADNFVRQITMDIVRDGKVAHSLITNSYVAIYARLFDEVNKMLSAELKIVYDKTKFKGIY